MEIRASTLPPVYCPTKTEPIVFLGLLVLRVWPLPWRRVGPFASRKPHLSGMPPAEKTIIYIDPVRHI